jgi:hypothetical protein
MAKRQVLTFDHVLRIHRWNFDYAFGINTLKGEQDLYSDFRNLVLQVSLIRPKGIKATEGHVVCSPDKNFAAGSPTRQRRFGDNLGKSSSTGPRPVGHVSYRGKDYQANLFMPPDAFSLVLMMLSAGKYRFVSFDAEKGARDAPISSFYFSEIIEDDPDVALAGWDDV